jgi:hypothetical protein
MMDDTVESLIAHCRANSRVCPQPKFWQELWEMLPGRKRVGVGWEPSAPLILGAWHDAPAMLKMVRVAEHIQWADEHGALETVSDFLRNLREEDWYHVGE